MKNRQFDEAVFRRIRGENMKIREEIEENMQNELYEKRNLQARPIVRRPLRVAVAVLAGLVLICGVALAAINWSSRSLLSYEDVDGQVQVNEELASHAQPIEQSFRGKHLSVNVVDAIFDGNALVLAWTLTNDGEKPLYIYCDIQVNGDYSDMGSYTQVDELFIQPGETIQSGFSARTDGESYGEVAQSCDVALYFTAFASEREVVEIGALDGDTPGEDIKPLQSYRENIKTLIAQGKLPIAPDGVIEMGEGVPYQEGMTRADLLTESGLMEQTEAVDATFTIARNAETKTALHDGKPIEKMNDGYTLRVLQADMGLNSATFRLERVFENREAAEAFQAYYSGKLGPLWGFSFQDETGDIWWNSNGGGSADTDAPEEQADGTWVWGYTAVMTNLQRTPKSITIVPTRDDTQGGALVIEFPQEALTLSFE